MTRFVTIKKAEELTGYSVDAINTKIRDGVWLEKQVWVLAPDGRRLIDMKGYESWAENGSTTAFGSLQPAQSKSTSTTPAKGAKKGSNSSPPPLT